MRLAAARGVFLLPLVAVGCSPPVEPGLALPKTAPSLDELRGRLVSEGVLEMVAGTGWRREEGSDGAWLWRLGVNAELTFHRPVLDGEGGDSPGPPWLAVRIAPGPDGIPDFRPLWNGRPVPQRTTPDGWAWIRVGAGEQQAAGRAGESDGMAGGEMADGVSPPRAGIVPLGPDGPRLWGVLTLRPPPGSRFGEVVAST
ncbi:MAG: hypothetical protein MI919_01410, partial [Holophagales bacterium]|nr:hypothetical protein [Holophagales bacterium]